MFEDDINKQRKCIFLLAQQTKQNIGFNCIPKTSHIVFKVQHEALFNILMAAAFTHVQH